MMSILFFFAFNVLFVPFALSLKAADRLPCVLCAYEGQAKNSKYTFTSEDLPERCDTVLYSSYLFDLGPNEADKSAITTLVGAGKLVYVTLGFNGDSKWADVFGDVNGVMLDPMRDYLNSLAVTGIVLDTLRLYGVDPEPPADYATQINTFVTKMKADIPSLKVGMLLDGYDCKSFADTNKFDFTVINDQVDFYVVDASKAGIECNADSAKTGRYPKTSTIASVKSLDDICQGVSGSTINQEKVLIGLADFVTKVNLNAASGNPTSYGEYCTDPHTDTNVLWCADSITIMYDEVTYVKSYFKGIGIFYLDRDDCGESCGCGKNPVANNYIDSWLGVEMTNCDKIAG